MKKYLTVALVALSIIGIEAQSQSDVNTAVAIGTKAKGGQRGLVLRDAGAVWAQALAGMGNTGRNAMPSNGFWVEAWTPLSWVEQQASNAAKQYRVVAVDESMLAPVFRVVVHPDTPSEVTARGMVGTSSVEHVVLRSEDRKVVVQPSAIEPFDEDAQNAMGAKVGYQGVMAQFTLDDLQRVRGTSGEFFITVIGKGGYEKDFKVKAKHFKALR